MIHKPHNFGSALAAMCVCVFPSLFSDTGFLGTVPSDSRARPCTEHHTAGARLASLTRMMDGELVRVIQKLEQWAFSDKVGRIHSDEFFLVSCSRCRVICLAVSNLKAQTTRFGLR